jgi:hypothetical protein
MTCPPIRCPVLCNVLLEAVMSGMKTILQSCTAMLHSCTVCLLQMNTTPADGAAIPSPKILTSLDHLVPGKIG